AKRRRRRNRRPHHGARLRLSRCAGDAGIGQGRADALCGQSRKARIAVSGRGGRCRQSRLLSLTKQVTIMPINILMPALSPTMEKGNLAKWLKKEGDKVKSGDVIAEIETDKATMEVEAVDEGTLAKIVVAEGTQDVPVNDVIAVLAGDGEDVKAAGAGAASAPPKAAAAPAATPAAAPKPALAPAPTPAKAEGAATAAPQAAASASPQAAPQTNGRGRIFSSPLARRLAKDAGIELARINGSGPHGRVIARDVEAAKSGKGLKAPAAGAGASALAPSMSDKQILALFEPGSYEIVPHDGMR